MWRILFLAAWCAALVACGSDNSGDGGEGGDSAVDESSGEDDGCAALQYGTYLVTYEELDGSCGDIPSGLTQVSAADTELPDGCSFDDPLVVSDDGCRRDVAYTCLSDGFTISFVFAMEMEPDGDGMHGLATLRASGGGLPACVSTYAVEWDRQ